MKYDRYVAMLDVLGFSDVVRNSWPPHLEQVVSSLQSGTALSVGFLPPLVVDDSHSGIEAIMLSDTIILWTLDDSPTSFLHLINTTRMVMSNAFGNGLPLRGGISVGPAIALGGREVTASVSWNKMILGEAVIEAHDLEKAQEWSGCVVSQAAINRYKEQNVNQDLSLDAIVKRHALIEYDVPWKPGTSFSNPSMVINWPLLFLSVPSGWATHSQVPDLSDHEIRQQFERNGKSIQSDKAQKRVEKTMEFVNHVKTIIRPSGLSLVA